MNEYCSGLRREIKPPILYHRENCPLCGKRAFDVAHSPNASVTIQMKCPNCHKIVDITIAS